MGIFTLSWAQITFKLFLNLMPPIEALTGILKNNKNRELCSFINSLYSNVPSANPIFLYIQEKCPSIMNKHNKLMDTFFFIS